MSGNSKKTKIFLLTAVMLVVSAVFHIYADKVWEGSAAMGRYGEFPFTGYYGASNSFPQNAFVEVENLENGKRTRVIIVDRLTDSGLLMLVSNEAAQELGIYQSDIARIKVRMISRGTSVEEPQYDDLAYNPDPDLNPAAALMEPEDLVNQEIAESRAATGPEITPEPEPETITAVEPEPEPETVTAVEPEPEPEPEPVEIAETETVSESESEFPVLTEMPPKAEGLGEAEILVTEKEVPADIAEDVPEKPFDWPDGVIEPEPEPEPEPLYLTMDDFEESSPLSSESAPDREIHAPEALTLWPAGGSTENTEAAEIAEELAVINEDVAAATPAEADDITGDGRMDFPAANLELVSSGLGETAPAYRAEDRFKLNAVPEIAEKVTDAEYITETSDYYSPTEKEAEISDAGLPVPEPEIPEEVIAMLVGDHLLMAETTPSIVDVDSEYIDTPELIAAADAEDSAPADDLLEAFPLIADGSGLVADSLPVLPGKDEGILVEVANGYISPDEAEFTGTVKDYPDYSSGMEPSEIPETGEELAYSPAPEEDLSSLPEMKDVPEIVSADGDDEAETVDVEPAVPEYDESLDVTLVPAEVRPPELVEEDTGLLESEPAETEPLETDIAEHSPEVETAETVVEVEEGPAVVETVTAAEPEPEPEPETEPVVVSEPVTVVEAPPVTAAEPELITPEHIMMVSKLQQQKHYLQLGAYREKNSALKAAGRLEANYPVTILTDEAPAGVSYKLLLGPLTADESGIMLYNFRAGGYSDAFIRRIE